MSLKSGYILLMTLGLLMILSLLLIMLMHSVYILQRTQSQLEHRYQKKIQLLHVANELSLSKNWAWLSDCAQKKTCYYPFKHHNYVVSILDWNTPHSHLWRLKIRYSDTSMMFISKTIQQSL